MCTRKGEKMDSIIELIYDGIQESSLIQKEIENSQKEKTVRKRWNGLPNIL